MNTVQRFRRFSLYATIFFCVFGISKTSRAWGGEGHAFVAQLAIKSLPDGPLRSLLNTNGAWFAVSSSWPDKWRSRPDNAEAPRHFLDGERFGVGTTLTKLPRDYKALVKIRTYEQLRSDGLVPWTVGRQYKLLVSAFREKRWDDAMLHAAYLSHYVGDSHVPFHATENYDGQLSEPSQKGVHARFETLMLQRSITASDLQPGVPTAIINPISTTLQAAQDSLAQVPVILAADKEAVKTSGGNYDEVYWAAFTPKARPIAIARLQTAGRTLAGLLLAAWRDGGSPVPPVGFVMTDRLMPYSPAFVPRGQPQSPAVPLVTDEAKEAARARVQTIVVKSALLGRDVSVNVVVPENYSPLAKTRYSTLYVLHGTGGNNDDWNQRSGIAAYAADYRMIVVMPDASGDGWYINTPNGGKYEDFFVKELVPAIDKQFRTLAKRQARAIAGNSMGGYGAWRLALAHNDLFGTAAAMSGAFFVQKGDDAEAELRKTATALYGGSDDAAWTRFEAERVGPRITKLVGKSGEWKGPALYFDVGKNDGLLPGNRRLEQFLLEQDIPYEFAEFNGEHNWEYWDEHIRDVLQFAARHLVPPTEQ